MLSISLWTKSIKEATKMFYLANRVLVLIEEGLKFQTFGSGQGSDLSVRSYGHRGRLRQQTVEQP